ncbi:hypothetical protein MARINOS108_10205 [Marinoscillum sp. 108]|nr:hypothetical protein MARINOS108_10205 [Marinoscillum sp. 108]
MKKSSPNSNPSNSYWANLCLRPKSRRTLAKDHPIAQNLTGAVVDVEAAAEKGAGKRDNSNFTLWRILTELCYF